MNAADVIRDGRNNAYVFTPGMTPDFTRNKTIKGRTGYTRCTTYVDCLDDTSNLSKYGQRNVLRGLVARPTLLVHAKEALRLGTPDDKIVKDALNDVAYQARTAAYENKKADIGTAIHTLCELADLEALERRDPLAFIADVSGDYHNDVAAYLDVTKHLKPLIVEQLVIVDSLKVAGTPDRVVEWTGPDTTTPDGTPVTAGDVFIADIKTGSLEWSVGKIAMQLAVYANAVLYEQHTNTRYDQPGTRHDWAIIVHVPAGTGTARLVWVDIAAGWEAVKLACHVRAWRSVARKLATPFPTVTLADQIAATVSVAELRALWSANLAAFTDGDNGVLLQDLAKARAATLTPDTVAAELQNATDTDTKELCA